MLRMGVQMTNDTGSVRATLLGNPDIFGVGASRDEAMNSLYAELERIVRERDVRWTVIDGPLQGILADAGTFRDDPDLDDIVAETYRRRDAEKLAEFPE
jgi:hypothetical protein